ncbi:MAG: hypothetical protein KAR35_08010 [Candidatus Heimdallarchaeota archaeon]|nr:hypothetical protein [Candidatus Heimdallarchaeota archaeon]MCK5049303.1 hypothetical protein [Candidatus Heimdallarchaeota archaeon]
MLNWAKNIKKSMLLRISLIVLIGGILVIGGTASPEICAIYPELCPV